MDKNKMIELTDEALEKVSGGTETDAGATWNNSDIAVSPRASWCPYCCCETEPESFATCGDAPVSAVLVL